jgi:hypothetical protein
MKIGVASTDRLHRLVAVATRGRHGALHVGLRQCRRARSRPRIRSRTEREMQVAPSETDRQCRERGPVTRRRASGTLSDEPLSEGRESRFRPVRQRMSLTCREILRERRWVVPRIRVRRRRGTSRCVALTRDVPAVYPRVAYADDNKCLFAGTSYKPSDGLEPSTPSLPWRCSTN